MFKLMNSFGSWQVFDDLDKALDAYEDECNFCQFVGLYDLITGEAIAESW